MCHCLLSDINECKSRPCKNGGSCNDEVNAYSCTCTNGHIGIDCQTGRCDYHITSFCGVLMFRTDLMYKLRTTFVCMTKLNPIKHSCKSGIVFDSTNLTANIPQSVDKLANLLVP